MPNRRSCGGSIWRSDDAGERYDVVRSTGHTPAYFCDDDQNRGSQGGYDNAVRVSPEDEDFIAPFRMNRTGGVGAGWAEVLGAEGEEVGVSRVSAPPTRKRSVVREAGRNHEAAEVG